MHFECFVMAATFFEMTPKARKPLVSLPFWEVGGEGNDEEIIQKARKPVVSLAFGWLGMVNLTPKWGQKQENHWFNWCFEWSRGLKWGPLARARAGLGPAWGSKSGTHFPPFHFLSPFHCPRGKWVHMHPPSNWLNFHTDSRFNRKFTIYAETTFRGSGFSKAEMDFEREVTLPAAKMRGRTIRAYVLKLER